MIPNKDRIRGSLIGGAIGDALGYPVEFVRSYEKIQEKFGPNGITRYDTSHWWL
jgi:ADP-ribosylglycohydrolase